MEENQVPSDNQEATAIIEPGISEEDLDSTEVEIEPEGEEPEAEPDQETAGQSGTTEEPEQETETLPDRPATVSFTNSEGVTHYSTREP